MNSYSGYTLTTYRLLTKLQQAGSYKLRDLVKKGEKWTSALLNLAIDKLIENNRAEIFYAYQPTNWRSPIEIYYAYMDRQGLEGTLRRIEQYDKSKLIGFVWKGNQHERNPVLDFDVTEETINQLYNKALEEYLKALNNLPPERGIYLT